MARYFSSASCCARAAAVRKPNNSTTARNDFIGPKCQRQYNLATTRTVNNGHFLGKRGGQTGSDQGGTPPDTDQTSGRDPFSAREYGGRGLRRAAGGVILGRK